METADTEGGVYVGDESTSDIILLIALLPCKLPDTQQVSHFLPIQLAHYARVRLNEYNAVAYPNGLILKNRRPGNMNCPHPHLVELEALENSKKSLEAYFNQLVIDGNQDNLTWPDVFPRNSKRRLRRGFTVSTENRRQIY